MVGLQLEDKSREELEPTRNTENPVQPVIQNQITNQPESNNETHTSTLKVYSRKKQLNPTSQASIIVHESGTEDNTQNSIPNFVPYIFDDIEIPIALRKGVRSCTQHPMSHFVSLQNLSPHYKAFLSSIMSQKIPASVQEALTSRPWKEAIDAELMALERTKHGRLWTYQNLRGLLAASGFSP